MSSKPNLVIIGAGWAGFYITEHISRDLYNVTVIAPRRTSAFTPLLASAAVGLFNFYLAEEPIRSKSRSGIKYIKANVTNVDFATKTCKCSPAFEEDQELAGVEFDIHYDILIVAPGCAPNTFDTPGVAEHGLFMKNVSDAMAVRKRLFDLLEKASLPTTPKDRVRQLLHIAIVGGGPTGIEMTAELDDLCKDELRYLYPEVAADLRISVFDVAANILGAYDRSLYEYANTQLVRRHINVRTNTKIQRVTERDIYLQPAGPGDELEVIPYGMLIWATGNKSVPLTEALDVRKTPKGLGRILTDSRLRVYKSKESDEVFDEVFALGDAADIDGALLPTTAEVAVQKAKYLVNVLNSQGEAVTEDYKFQAKGLVSYIGGRDGIIMGNASNAAGWTGKRAWLAWRAGSVMWTRSWRNRLGILITWTMNVIFGKEIAKI